ncbi:MAG: hypothetical protein IPJ51_10740 [Saprospiraceae bacterium]|nr:hypothetical protein [Saprospiraceae bacterium]
MFKVGDIVSLVPNARLLGRKEVDILTTMERVVEGEHSFVVTELFRTFGLMTVKDHEGYTYGTCDMERFVSNPIHKILTKAELDRINKVNL